MTKHYQRDGKLRMIKAMYWQKPKDSLVQEIVDVPAGFIWAMWTQPSLLKTWWTLPPYTIDVIEMNVVNNGTFHIATNHEHKRTEIRGVYIDVNPNKRLVITDAITKDLRPASNTFGTIIVELNEIGQQTEYKAWFLYKDGFSMRDHFRFGHYSGWVKNTQEMLIKAKELYLNGAKL